MPTIDPVRMRPWFGDPPRTAPPETPGYRLVTHEQFDIGRGTLAGIASLPIWAIGLTAVIGMLGGRTSYSADLTLFNAVGALLVAFVLVPVIHELIHGLAALVCGARPSFGVGAGFAYTTFREPVGRNPYLAIGLAPVIVLTIAVVVLGARWDAMTGWFILFGVVNGSGSIGDLWMAWRIARHPREAICYDLADGFAILVPDPAAPGVEGSRLPAPDRDSG